MGREQMVLLNKNAVASFERVDPDSSRPAARNAGPPLKKRSEIRSEVRSETEGLLKENENSWISAKEWFFLK